MHNPFYYGNPTPGEIFVGRTKELKRIKNRICSRAQSTAIIGEPKTGKTSLFERLESLDTWQDLLTPSSRHVLFRYLDAQTLGAGFTQEQFWGHALQPLHEKAILLNPESNLAQSYRVCFENNFGTFVLERLLAQMRQERWSLILLLDEFDLLLHHPILNSAEFFGSLRSLTSRSQGALALVIACRRPLALLNEDTQQFNRTGSPYFNFFDEITLGPLEPKAVETLLDRAGDRFTAEDRRFIIRIAGGHPYLLQVTASALWEAYEEADLSAEDRFREASQAAHDQAAGTLSYTWQLWSPAMRKAFAVIALDHLSTLPAEHKELLQGRVFDLATLLESLRDLSPELRSLHKQGFVVEDKDNPGTWRVRPAAFLWWMADEIIRAVRDETELGKWLQAQEWGAFFKHGETARMASAMRWVSDIFNSGTTKFIETVAQKTAGSV